MKKSVYPLDVVLNLNTRLFINSLAGVSEENGSERISEHNNPLHWIAAHTVSSRYLMLMFLGQPGENPYNHLFENFKGYDAALTYPSFAEVKEEWNKVTVLLNNALNTVSEEQLAAEAFMKNPTGDFSNIGTLAFLAQHESYDIGQMGFLKKYHTKEAMSYN